MLCMIMLISRQVMEMMYYDYVVFAEMVCMYFL